MARRSAVCSVLALVAATSLWAHAALAGHGVATSHLETAILQFTAGGHVLGFTSKNLVVANGSHALQVEFVGATGAVPVADTTAAPGGGKAAPLGRVTYPELWKGIALTYDAEAGGICRSTYTLSAGADARQIRLRYNTPVTLESNGSLRLTSASGWMNESAPLAWQEIAGNRVAVQVAFRARGDKEIGFTLGEYDKNHALTIDPTLTWHTFLGSTDTDIGRSIGVDGGGNIYITGSSHASWGNPILPFLGGPSPYNNDAFVAKLNSAGVLQWNTFLGSALGNDFGYGIDVDSAGNCFVTGEMTFEGRGYDVFVAKLNTSGALQWNNSFGGTNNDYCRGIVVVEGGESEDPYSVVNHAGIYLTGWSGSETSGWVPANVSMFVVKLTLTGNMVWKDFFGDLHGEPSSIAVDGSGNSYVTGYSMTTWGTPVIPFPAYGGSYAFVAKVGNYGGVVWNTFLGSSDGGSWGYAIAVDGGGNCYVTGNSSRSWGEPVRAFTVGDEAFVAKLNTLGSLQWNTFLGEWDSSDIGYGIDVDSRGNSYVTGKSTQTWGTPELLDPLGTSGAFVAKLDASGTLGWNTFLPHSEGYSVVVKDNGNIYVGGDGTYSWGAPVDAYAGDRDAFVALLGPSTPITLVDRYRLYSPVTLEHLFTTDANEYAVLGTYVGTWQQEDVSHRLYNGPTLVDRVAAVPYYRLYDKINLWHHWTTDKNEYDILGKYPDRYAQEGIDGYLFLTHVTGSVPMYRLLYSSIAGLHHWTTDENERDVLRGRGWIVEDTNYVFPASSPPPSMESIFNFASDVEEASRNFFLYDQE